MWPHLVSRGLALTLAGLASFGASAQTAYFADGYHGGVYGHYPPTFTQYMVDSLRANPDWKINLEIEPETWDFVRTNTPEAYAAFQRLAADQSAGGRIEFVNPAYGQSYLWNISGESVVQQLVRGMHKLRGHFPNAQFATYSSEEPCFTSALPGLLKSLGFQQAVLKNPNTCWGGYTRAFGGELVNWTGPDGAALRTVPRYGIEALQPGSTWETIANANSPDYIRAALAAHIEHPVGMCLQDAGWRFGPWLQHVGAAFQPSQSTLWRNYFERIAASSPAPAWRLGQEDVQVSLVWGAQVLQRVAQQVRVAENRMVAAEKMAALASVWRNAPWPEDDLAEAWRTLLLSQHHDCWIVPYNRHDGKTWAEQVALWTTDTRQRSQEVLDNAMSALVSPATNVGSHFIRVFNTLGNARNETVGVAVPADWPPGSARVVDQAGNELPAQFSRTEAGRQTLIFPARAPAFGFNTYRLEKSARHAGAEPLTCAETNGLLTLQSDLYTLVLDANRGGTIQSWRARKLGGRELVDAGNARRFNELRGYFFRQGRFFSSADQPATMEVLESGPVRMQVRIRGRIESNLVTQTITLTRGEPRVDFFARIDWQGRPGIGSEYMQSGGYRAEQDHKAFYEDRYKLLALFPLNLPRTQIYKDAPWDVTESRLTNTLFENWSDLKNNVILHWVDAFDAAQAVGVTLLTDHTTSYAHGPDQPLGLTLQYSGVGLWGRDYSLVGATEVHYALLPHAGDWQQAGVWRAAAAWNEPLLAKSFQAENSSPEPDRSLLHLDAENCEITTARLENGRLLVRLFNPSTRARESRMHYGGSVSQVALVRLNGEMLRELSFSQASANRATFKIALPAFGVGTLLITPGPPPPREEH